VSEVTPISSAPIVAGISPLRREQARKKQPQKSQQPKRDLVKLPEFDAAPIQHVDELV
jgi:hypothetical protein